MNQMRYYIDANGNYLGGWDANPPTDALEVATPPEDARQVWDFGAEGWLPVPAPNPLDQSLTKRQIIAAMIVGAGTLDPEAAITSAIEAITDPVARALALNDWRNAPHYVRSHPLFNDPELMAAMNLTSEQIDGLWALGTQQPA